MLQTVYTRVTIKTSGWPGPEKDKIKIKFDSETRNLPLHFCVTASCISEESELRPVVCEMTWPNDVATTTGPIDRSGS